jgi:hypothetical protein
LNVLWITIRIKHLNIAGDITSDITSDMKTQFRQGKTILMNDDLDIVTIIKLQVMKITATLLAEPTDIAIIASFISSLVLRKIL